MSRILVSAVTTSAILALSPVLAATKQPISLKTPSGELHGTLMLPDGQAVRVVALIIAGSGPTDRDGNNPMAKNDSLKLLSEALANAGIASVRYDKRGVGESASGLTDESKLIFRDLVTDARAWIDRLAADRDFDEIVVIGHSEGATIGLLAAQQGIANAYVSISGPAKRASQGLRAQLEGRLPPQLATRSEEILLALESGQTVSDVPPQLLALYRPSVQPYLMDWFQVIPTEEIKKLKVPILIVQGDTDIQVPVTAAQVLHAANPKSELAVIEGMNHVLKLVPNDQSQQLASYRDPSLPIAPELSRRIIAFISQLGRR